MFEQTALVQEHDIGGQPFRLGDVMRRHEDLCAGGPDGADQFLDTAYRGRVEIRGGLVQQQHLGFEHECPRDGEPLLLPT